MASNLFRRKTIDSILRDADTESKEHKLNRNLNVRDLTAFGIAAIIGAGIFSTIGTAASTGGPAVSLLFVFTAIACGFSAMCYAQFASSVPISGSAYTYSYVSFGELIAWIIGWDLIMEYAVGNIAVAISWSDYFTGFMGSINIHIPEYLTVDYLSALRGYHSACIEIAKGIDINSLTMPLKEAYFAWVNAPMIGDLRLIADIPAFSIVVFITVLVYIGIHEAKVASNTMVLLKVSILLVVIGVGAFYINPQNWNPFAPNGLAGVMKGVSGVFFAYIGFDAISTTAEECKNPRRDLPRAMIYSLVITTVLYILISLVLTGMVHYSELAVGDPLAYVFQKLHLTKLSGVIAISAIIAMASVLLVFQVGQPRIWMSMSRDGLLPKIFSKIHKRFKTPAFSTIITGIMVAIPSLFLNLTEVTNLTSIGTLFAFALVSAGVLLMDKQNNKPTSEKTYKVPYLNSMYFLPIIWILVFMGIFYFNSDGVYSFFKFGGSANSPFNEKIPLFVFMVISIFITLLGIIKKLSLIPILGLLTNLYLMTELGISNWLRFGIWLLLGLIIYYSYGYKNSKLAHSTTS
ncbi:MAG: amino acid permease [Bacteroidales bacterium]|nr:amino acid permease [Bacteroidales bacterium]